MQAIQIYPGILVSKQVIPSRDTLSIAFPLIVNSFFRLSHLDMNFLRNGKMHARNAFQRKLLKRVDQRLLKDKHVAPQKQKRFADRAFPIMN